MERGQERKVNAARKAAMVAFAQAIARELRQLAGRRLALLLGGQVLRGPEIRLGHRARQDRRRRRAPSTPARRR